MPLALVFVITINDVRAPAAPPAYTRSAVDGFSSRCTSASDVAVARTRSRAAIISAAVSGRSEPKEPLTNARDLARSATANAVGSQVGEVTSAASTSSGKALDPPQRSDGVTTRRNANREMESRNRSNSSLDRVSQPAAFVVSPVRSHASEIALLNW